jgi:hypothetical protein
MWTKQRDITQVKFEKNISFFEAKKLVEQRANNNNAVVSGVSGTRRVGISYAQASTQTQTRSAYTETDLTWPLAEKLPIAIDNIATCRSSSSSQTSSTNIATNVPHYSPQKNGKPNKQNNQFNKPGPVSRTHSNRQRKGSADPIQTFNRFRSLESLDDLDDMEVDISISSKVKQKTK